MKSRRLLVKKIAKNVSVENQDLSDDFGLNAIAESEMQRVKRKVSPDLYDMLEQQLLGFHGDMQIEMAENLSEFAYVHVAFTTGCPSADMVLDICYTWIAVEQGILKEDYKNKRGFIIKH